MANLLKKLADFKKNFISFFSDSKRLEKLLFLFITLFALVGSGVSVYKHETGLSTHFDMVTMYQPTYNSYMGIKTGDYSRIFEMTEPHAGEEGRRVSRAAYHFDIILIPISLLLFIYESPNVLLILQAFCLSFSAWFLYLIAKKVFEKDKNKEIIGALIALLYLFYFPMHSALLMTFHPVTIGTFLLFGMVYFLYTEQLKKSLVFFLLALTTKESVPFTTLMYGLLTVYYFLRKDHKFSKGIKTGIFIIVISVIYGYLINVVAIPHFAEKSTFGENLYAGIYYKELGSNQKEILTTITSNPQIVLRQLISARSVVYLIITNMPTLFVNAFGLPFNLTTIPEYLINILSTEDAYMTSTGGHYESILMVSLYVSATIGFFNIKRLFGQKIFKIWLVGAVLVTLTSCRFSYFINIGNLIYDYARPSSEEIKKLKEINKEIKRTQIPIAGTRHVTPFLVVTRNVYRLSSYDKAELVIVKKEDFAKIEKADTEYMLEFYNKLVQDPNYELIETVKDLEIFERK